MTRREAERINRQESILVSLGFTMEESNQLRRISRTLQHWFELECGYSNEYGSFSIERNETTGKPYRVTRSHHSNREMRFPIADRERGAMDRLREIINKRNDRVLMSGNAIDVKNPPLMRYYIQSDPRGAALYIIRPGDVPNGADVSAYYTRGICVY